MKKSQIFLLGLKLFLVCFSLCHLTDCASLSFSPPYLLEDLYLLTDKADSDAQLKAVFTLHNTSAVTMKEVAFTFYVCSADGELLLSEPVTVYCCRKIAAGDSSIFTVALDAYFEELPDKSCRIEGAYVPVIYFDDGRHWKDPFGMYAR